MTLNATTSHTVGPYYHIGLTWLNREDLTVTRHPRRTRGDQRASGGRQR